MTHASEVLPPPLVSVRGLSKHYPIAGTAGLFGKPLVVRAVEDVSLTIVAGQHLGLVGESGCGKSTLGRCILHLISPSAGTVQLDGTTLETLSSRDLRRFRRRAQMIFQDPFGSLNPRLTVHEILAEPLRTHGLVTTKQAEVPAVEQILEQVGLPPDSRRRYPHEFSGGQRQRIGIARALAVKPTFVVADEPVSALDVSIQAQIVNLLRDLAAREKLTYLFISHDLKVVEHLCDRVAVMYLGRIVEIADTDSLYGSPRHPYTTALLASVPEPPLIGAALSGAPRRRETPSQAERRRLFLSGDPPSPTSPPPGCPFHPRCARYVEAGRPPRCHTEVPQLRQPSSQHAKEHLVACHLA